MHTEPALPGVPEPPLTLALALGLPTGITQLRDQCWEAPDDDMTHYPNERSALDASCEHTGPCDDHPRLEQMTNLCWTATAVCGKTVGSDDFDEGHFPDPDYALQAALRAEFTVVDGVLRCEADADCEAKL